MLSDDVYLANFRATVAELEAWAATLSDVAAIEIDREESCWRVAFVPHSPQACPFELMLRRDQRFDLTVGPETYEDQLIPSLNMFKPLLAAIVGGRVVTSTWLTAATGLRTATETHIAPQGRACWSAERRLLASKSDAGDGLLRRDHHYVPYSRGA